VNLLGKRGPKNDSGLIIDPSLALGAYKPARLLKRQLTLLDSIDVRGGRVLVDLDDRALTLRVHPVFSDHASGHAAVIPSKQTCLGGLIQDELIAVVAIRLHRVRLAPAVRLLGWEEERHIHPQRHALRYPARNRTQCRPTRRFYLPLPS